MSMDEEKKFLAAAFMRLQQPVKQIQCMHVYIDGTLRNFRSKDQTLPRKPENVADLPLLEFCGSATDFDVGNLADYYAKPVKFYRDPFRGGDNMIVYCETYCREGLPTFANNRYRLLTAMQKKESQINKFIFHQTYTLLRRDGHPLTYLDPAYNPDSKSGFICGREIAESHYKACLYAGVKLASYEPASNLGQWTYSIGPGTSVDVADDVSMSRMLLIRVAEDFGVTISLETIPVSSRLVPIYAGLSVITDSMDQRGKLRVVEDLLSQFVVKIGKTVRITSLPEWIRISNISAEMDPYSLLTKVIESSSNSFT